jgi:predicted enzyme related to lactoylglutathione lyase
MRPDPACPDPVLPGSVLRGPVVPGAVLAGITVDCVDPQRLAEFWSALLDRPISESLPGWRRVGSLSDGAPVLTFQPVPEPRQGKVRIHPDVRVPDIDRAVAAVRGLGGRLLARHDYDEGVVSEMSDPEGHEFCLVQYF